MHSALPLFPMDALHWLPTDTLHWLPLDAALHWLGLGLVLLGTVVVGICVHELLHLVPLYLVDADYTVTVLPDEKATGPTAWTTLRSALSSGLVRVEITHVQPSTPDWVLRVAAILPLALALPLLLVGAGVVPDPLATDDHLAAVVFIALTGCGLPSPADWSVVWHGSRFR